MATTKTKRKSNRPRRPSRTGRTQQTDPQRVNALRLAILRAMPPIRVAVPGPSHVVTAAYAARLRAIVDRSWAIVQRTLQPALDRQVALQQVADAKRKKPPNPDQQDLPIDIDDSLATMAGQLDAYAISLPATAIAASAANAVEAQAMATTLRISKTLGLRAVDNGTQLADLRDVWVKNNATLIVSQPRAIADRIQTKVQAMVEAGSRWETISAQIQAEHGIGQRRADLIARDQVSKYNGALNESNQRSVGISHYEWRGAMDARERHEHVALQGFVFSWDKPSPLGHPGEPIQCLPERSRIDVAPLVQVAFRRRYHGKLTEFVAHDGVILRCTPNHPVLTGVGWKPAQFVDVGDHLICDLRPVDNLPPRAKVQHAQPTIQQVFDALAVVGCVQRARGNAGDFHGDAPVAQQINVVRLDWGLRDDIDAATAQDVGKLLFTCADMRLPFVPRARQFVAVFRCLGFSANGVMRGFCKALAIFGAGARHANQHRVLARTWRDAVASQQASDGCALAPAAFGKCLDAIASLERGQDFVGAQWLGVVRAAVGPLVDEAATAQSDVQVVGVAAEITGDLAQGRAVAQHRFRAIKEIRQVQWGGHVYNLETACGWFRSSVIVHNCRCVAQPVTSATQIAKAQTQPEVTQAWLTQRTIELGPKARDVGKTPAELAALASKSVAAQIAQATNRQRILGSAATLTPLP